MFVSIGLFFSALTRNQIIAAIWTFVVLFMFVLLTLLGYTFAVERQAIWADAVRFVAVLYQVQSFGTGQLDLRYIALHLSICVFMLYMSVKILESRRYR
jgi:ABC-2 type transport system permease protein